MSAEIFQTKHLLFLIPMCTAVLWVIVGVFLGAVLGDADVDVEADADADADADGAGVALGVLSFLGIGDIPLLLWMEIVAILWGLSGLGASLLGAGMFLSTQVAVATSLAGTAGISRVLERLLPAKMESEAIAMRDAVGLIGKVVSTKVDERYGEGLFHNDHHQAIYLPIRTERGQAVLPEHQPIVVLEIDEVEGFAYVMAADELALEVHDMPDEGKGGMYR